MSADIIINVCDLGKMYRIYDQPTDRLKQLAWGRYRKSPYGTEFWALRSANFQIARGETVGIVGRNGSGKSTLLQLVANTLSPTTGSVRINGSVAALLELGSGFNPDFTGRENLHLYGTIRNISTQVMAEKLEEIITFADIGEFLDRPVKTYSSGMLVRLAFAAAIILPCEILIIDEALAVGDEAFTRKCFDRIKSFQAAGKTLLFVSHSAGAVVELCQRAILLDQGEILMQGEPKIVVANYQRLQAVPAGSRDALRILIGTQKHTPDQMAGVKQTLHVENQAPAAWLDPNLTPTTTTIYPSTEATINNARLETLNGQIVNHLIHGERYVYRYRIDFVCEAKDVRFGMLIKTISGFEIGGTVSSKRGDGLLVKPPQSIEVAFSWDCLLNPGTYFFNAGVLAICNEEEIFLSRILDALMFRVLPDPNLTSTALVDFRCQGTVSMSPFS
jgi:lipopolysaccharide transport system ATP-binding protein